MIPTGSEWLRDVNRRGKQLKRVDPEAYRVLVVVRDVLLDAAAAGVIDLSKPLLVMDDGEGVVFENVDEDEQAVAS